MAGQHAKITEQRSSAGFSFSAALDVFLRDIKRIFTNPIALIVFLGILVLPSLYAWYNIVASWDPYSHTSDVQVAVVNKDKGCESELVGTLNIGETLQTKLESNSTIGWTFVDEDTAMDGVSSGAYYAAIVIPENFSKSFVSIVDTGDGQEKQTPQIDYYVNEKINGVAVKVTDTAATTIESQINTTFSSAVSKVISEKVLTLSRSVKSSAADASQSIAEKLSSANTALGSLRNTLVLANDALYTSRDGIESTQAMLTSLQATLDDLSASLTQSKATVSTIRVNIDALYEEYKESGSTLLLEVLKNVSTDLESLSGLIDRTYDAVTGLGPVISSTQSLLNSLYTSMGQLASSNEAADGVFSRIQTNLDNISSRLQELSTSTSSGLLGVLLGLDPSSVSDFLKNPVTLTTEHIYPVDTYGSGVAPFYTNLALWVGGFVLVSILRVEVSRKGLKHKNLTSKEAYVGRGLLFSAAGLAQGFICCIGDLIIGVQCVSPVAFVLTGMFLSFVYANIIYMLAATFKHVGKAFAMILIIMQIPGSSGMYPIEMMPYAFQVIHPVLPFTYGIAAVRETLAGFYEATYWSYLAVMMIFLLAALAIGLFVKPRITNLVLLFDRQLRKTDFMVCEEEGHFENREQSFKDVVKALLRSETYRKETMLQIKDFEATYETKRKRGLLFMAFGPLAVLALVSIVGCFVDIDINIKIFCMFLWIVVLIVSVAYIVSLEYSHQRFSAEAHYLKKYENADDPDRTAPIGNLNTGQNAISPTAKGGAQ